MFWVLVTGDRGFLDYRQLRDALDAAPARRP
ncbi:MAG: DUF2493 domain-containing protein [Gemmataceae bacterium]|nr:DUF2493 domain-containing protein [Gemmataceae bacterium]